MHAAEGIITARGGMTSHAAVVARGMGRPCVSGAGQMKIDYAKKLFMVGRRVVHDGEMVTIDGSNGQVLFGEARMIKPELTGEFAILMAWADKTRRMKVRTNAETPQDCQTAVEFGAEGIGLCRTEHMFFDGERIAAVREMILSNDQDGRVTALDKILPMQRDDFAKIFRIMGELPCTIRLLDPPLHEFLPHTGAGNLRGPGCGREGNRLPATRRSDDPAGRHGRRALHPQGARRRCRPGRGRGDRCQAEIHDRHDDRIAARLPDGRRYRQGCAILLFRDQ